MADMPSDGAGTGRPVVVGADGSESALRAVRWAARTAASRGRGLHVVHAYGGVDPSLVADASLWRRYQQDLLDHAREIAARAVAVAHEAAPSVTVTEELVDGAAAPALLERADDALLVVGEQGSGGLGGTLVGSVASSVAAHAVAPVVVVRGDEPTEPAAPVVVGVDGSPVSEAAIDFAVVAADLASCPLVAVHTWWDPLFDPVTEPLLGWDAIVNDEKGGWSAEQLAGCLVAYAARRWVSTSWSVSTPRAPCRDARWRAAGRRAARRRGCWFRAGPAGPATAELHLSRRRSSPRLVVAPDDGPRRVPRSPSGGAEPSLGPGPCWNLGWVSSGPVRTLCYSRSERTSPRTGTFALPTWLRARPRRRGRHGVISRRRPRKDDDRTMMMVRRLPGAPAGGTCPHPPDPAATMRRCCWCYLLLLWRASARSSGSSPLVVVSAHVDQRRRDLDGPPTAAPLELPPEAGLVRLQDALRTDSCGAIASDRARWSILAGGRAQPTGRRPRTTAPSVMEALDVGPRCDDHRGLHSAKDLCAYRGREATVRRLATVLAGARAEPGRWAPPGGLVVPARPGGSGGNGPLDGCLLYRREVEES